MIGSVLYSVLAMCSC